MTWQPVHGRLLTRWAAEITPDNAWRSYPRPQLGRPHWLNLNGLWDYAVTPQELQPEQFSGQILVPFPLEAALSGVQRALQPDEWLWYRRDFTVPEDWQGQRLLLHFGAVDWETQVFINGQLAGQHRGGYLPFYFDISPYIQAGSNEIRVRVWDPTDQHWQQRGKQVLQPKSIWYTAVSGIWQTVWLEPVPETYIAGLKLTPDIDRELLSIETSIHGISSELQVRAVARIGEQVVSTLEATAGQRLELQIPEPHLWSPDDPHLYALEVELLRQERLVDRVESYFGMRKFSLGRDPNGHLRLCLNDQPLFQYGPLDQGYWPDGLYTPPSEAAMRSDLEFCKQAGFNMLRKHIKVEPARYYYDCDRLGLIVWQDMINGGKAVSGFTSLLAVLFNLKRRDDWRYARAGRAEKESRDDYWRELQALVDHLYNFPCIGLWVPFNEGWGQFDANAVAEWLKNYDPTRPVDHASGWFDQGGGDCKSLHVYFKKLPGSKPEAQRALVLSEFGGYALKLDGHVWNPDSEFGYKKFANSQALTDAYLELLAEQLEPWIQIGLSAAVYTQTSDVEIEINGYLTYDRAVVKMDLERLAAAHHRLYQVRNTEQEGG